MGADTLPVRRFGLLPVRRLRALANVVLALLASSPFVPASSAAAQVAPVGPGGKKPGNRPASGTDEGMDGQPRREPIAFQPARSVWSKLGAAALPTDVKEPTGPELAQHLGLEVVGPQGPDSIVHYRHPKNGSLFVFVPGGTFLMGSNHGDIFSDSQVIDSVRRGKPAEGYFNTEQPQQTIYVSPFFAGVYEVTNAEYGQFLEEWRAGKVGPDLEWSSSTEKPEHTPYLWKDPAYDFWGDRQPVGGLTWLDAWAYSRWLGGRLPTEAEWEKAARGTDGRIWPWGNHFDPMRANTGESRSRRTVDVGTYPGGRSVYGCYDMCGNVGEFVLDSFEENTYRFMPKKDPCLLERIPLTERRVMRGGRWNKFALLHTTRVTGRGMILIKTDYPDPNGTVDLFAPSEYLCNGFRVALTPNVDLFPDGAMERLKAEYAAAEAEKRDRQKKGPRKAGAPPAKEGGGGD